MWCWFKKKETLPHQDWQKSANRKFVLASFFWQCPSTVKSGHLPSVACYQCLHHAMSNNYSPILPADYTAQDVISGGSPSPPDFSSNTENLHFLLPYCTIKTNLINFLAISLIHLQQCQTRCTTTLKQVPIRNVTLGPLNSVPEVSRIKSSQTLSHQLWQNWTFVAIRRTRRKKKCKLP